MITKLVTIEEALGVKIPQVLIDQYDLSNTDVQLLAKENGILISPLKKHRMNWEEKLKEAIKSHSEKENENIDVANIFDETDWTW